MGCEEAKYSIAVHFSGSVITSIFLQGIIEDCLSLRKARAPIAQGLGLSGYEGK